LQIECDNVLYNTLCAEDRNIARKAAVAQKLSTITPERALRALTEQLDALQKLRDRQYQKAEGDEAEWRHLTRSIIEACFGDPSSSLQRFYRAAAAGERNVMGISQQQHRRNFELRVREFDALLRSLIGMLRLQLPEKEIKGVYEPREQYDFYRDLSSLIESATQDLFIVDAYLNEKVFDLYVDKVPASATVRILSNKIGANVETIAKMYAQGRSLELRSSADVHDRMLFIDQRGWVSGQSIKDAAQKKPTYLVELDEPLLTAVRDIHNRIWAAATVVNLAP
jgi:hypothetical protein